MTYMNELEEILIKEGISRRNISKLDSTFYVDNQKRKIDWLYKISSPSQIIILEELSKKVSYRLYQHRQGYRNSKRNKENLMNLFGDFEFDFYDIWFESPKEYLNMDTKSGVYQYNREMQINRENKKVIISKPKYIKHYMDGLHASKGDLLSFMNQMQIKAPKSNRQFIGWHFLKEGIINNLEEYRKIEKLKYNEDNDYFNFRVLKEMDFEYSRKFEKKSKSRSRKWVIKQIEDYDIFKNINNYTYIRKTMQLYAKNSKLTDSKIKSILDYNNFLNEEKIRIIGEYNKRAMYVPPLNLKIQMDKLRLEHLTQELGININIAMLIVENKITVKEAECLSGEFIGFEDLVVKIVNHILTIDDARKIKHEELKNIPF